MPFVPFAIGKDLIFSALGSLASWPAPFSSDPKGPGGPPNPTIIQTNPRPDFYFLSIFAALALLPDWMEVLILFVAPVLMIGFLIILPFVSGTGEKSALRRPVAVLSVVLIVLVLGTLTYMGRNPPWSPNMTAWSATTVPVKYLEGRSPLQVHGALVLQDKQCRNCHALDGQGGQRGPALDTVATRLTHDELIRQVIQGGGNMPAYGKKLSPAELEAVVSFMDTLRPDWAEAAHNSAEPEGRRPLSKGFDRNTGQASPPDSGAQKAAVP